MQTTEPTTTVSAVNDRLIDVLFDDDHLVLVDHNGQPYVVMKALAAALGLDWRSQHEKITAKFGATMVEITTVAEDGKLRSMICLPLRKLPAWLYSITPGKLAPELRTKVVRYQEECDEVLWQHWTGTYVPKTNVNHVALSRLNLNYEREHTRISLELSRCSEMGIGRVLYDKYRRLSGLIGSTVVPLEEMAPAMRQRALPGV